MCVTWYKGHSCNNLMTACSQWCIFWIRKSKSALPSSFIPTLRHFWNRQYGQRFLWVLSIWQLWFSMHVYLLLFWTVRLKNPCGRDVSHLPVLLWWLVPVLYFRWGGTCANPLPYIPCANWALKEWPAWFQISSCSPLEKTPRPPGRENLLVLVCTGIDSCQNPWPDVLITSRAIRM